MGVVVRGSPGSSVVGRHLDCRAYVQRQDMSDEEKERRRQVCDNEEAYCRDWCGRSKQGQECYKKCWDDYVECLKKIPSNPNTPPDY